MNESSLGIWASKKRRKCEKKITDMRIKMQLSCKHKDVAEVDYVPSKSWFRAEPPFRVCKRCGFAERGWHCGYQILKNSNSTLDRNKAYQFVEGKIHNNGDFVRVGNILDKQVLYKMAVTGKKLTE